MRGWGWRHVRRSVHEPRDRVFKRGLVQEHRRLRNILGCHFRILIVRMGGECACISQYVSALISADGWDTKGDFGGRVGECCEFTKRFGLSERACGKSKKRDERLHTPPLRAPSLQEPFVALRQVLLHASCATRFAQTRNEGGTHLHVSRLGPVCGIRSRWVSLCITVGR